ncbi:glycoside hydrolase family 2 TIM barrel-domain containing protein [Hymenobacter coccineus]|uniref:Glycoside hydrolase n=1 Tax=Hymenobacter coccineus TaxID=1908235 RepID=A0A1G1TJI1_9BACT|nr:glycoside hydrolase family 2 TIM barrel-domain containing protein [Hymenobacter coccineus]OGX91026.1 glycoside hydrolase [Hymenobacter coccineus]
MKHLLRYLLSLTGLLLLAPAARAQSAPGTTALFDAGWRFHRGGAQGAERPGFDDAAWRAVDLPHDWSIEDLPGTASPFRADAISQVSGGFTTGGTGWYRKTFAVPAAQKGQRVQVQFDGVYMNAEVWLNGQSLGTHPYGYTSFWYDVTDKVAFGGPNVLAVQVQNEGANSRWYSGSGIYRHVWLRTLAPVHVAPWGTYLTTPTATAAAAQVRAQTAVANEGPQAAALTLVTRLRNARGQEVARTETTQTVAAGATATFDQTLALKKPALWSVDQPNLYTAVSEVHQGPQLTDRQETSFGVRTIAFDAARGFQLNGQPLKLKGGCFHHDNGPLGARAYDRAEERKIELLKASGYNAIRCTHNPPSPALLAACDRLGMLVIDEAFDMWRVGKNPFDYHLYFDQWWQADVASMVQRDRNHPSIILWSLGNEIPERGAPAGMATARQLGDYVRGLDLTRPVTAAVNGLNPDKDPYFAALDVSGYNYAAGGDHHQADIYAQDHARVPNRVMYGSESYALEAFGSWMAAVDHPYVLGDFVWTAIDYIGESSIGWLGYWQYQNFYPWNLAYCGDIDVCGWKRPQSYYRDALWQPNQVSVFVHPPAPSFPTNPDKQEWSKWEWDDVLADWTWPGQEAKPLTVDVYSSCERVELLLNGQSLGSRPTTRATQFRATWQVPYQAGVLKAVGYTGRQQVRAAELHTAAAPAQLRLTADRRTLQANGQDLSYVTVEVADAQGVRHPKAITPLKFELTGAGTIVGVGNANPTSTESYQGPQRNAWQGRCLVIVKSSPQAGVITLRATAGALPAATVALTTR